MDGPDALLTEAHMDSSLIELHREVQSSSWFLCPTPSPFCSFRLLLDTDVCRCLKVFKRGAALSKKRRKVASVWLFRQMFATPARDGFGSLKTLFVRGAHPSVVICVSVHLNKVIPPLLPSLVFLLLGMLLFLHSSPLSCVAPRMWFV